MSLVGSLEDLGLVDILQIVSLSRKSGVLLLRSESGDGRIVLCDGLVQGASVKGEIEDLRGLLIAEGCVDSASFERAEAIAASDAIGIDEALRRVCGLDDERLAGLRRDHVERSVMRMFAWRAGEFSFEIRDDLTEHDHGLMLPFGLNTQYLAMEATRLGDEAGQAGGSGGAGAHDAGEADEDAMMFSGETVATGTAADVVAESTIEAVERGEAAEESAFAADAAEDAPVEDPFAAAEDAPVEDPFAAAADAGAEVAIEAPPTGETRVPVAVSTAERPLAPTRTLVAIDADLSTLEWLKASVDGVFSRVHIFQRRDAALVRIRQYLVRGMVPMVVMADGPVDRRGPDAENFASRLRSLAPTMPILALYGENDATQPPVTVDGVLRRPTSASPDPDRWHLYEGIAQQLRDDLEPWLAGDRAVLARRRVRGVLARLKRVSDRLRDPATQGEVLTLVLDFAAETFGRVAMFMLRDDVAIGMAQRGMQDSGGPDGKSIRGIQLDADAMPQLFREVLDRCAPVGRSPHSESDRQWLQTFGESVPAEFYAAPLESGGVVVAIVYADNAPEQKPLPDPTPFEIVLHEAGLVLDRALLERALAERDGSAEAGA